MNLKSPSLAIVAVLALGSAALAQTPAPSSTQKTSPPATSTTAKMADGKMSADDARAWTQCKAMSHEAMMKDADCVRIGKAYKHEAGKSPAKDAPKD